jgi:hypothetical protein
VTARVRLENRRAGPARARRNQQETVILRDDEVVAVLPEGDPLRHALELPIEELRSMRVNLARVLDNRPRVKKVLEAIIEYKQDAGFEGRRQ